MGMAVLGTAREVLNQTHFQQREIMDTSSDLRYSMVLEERLHTVEKALGIKSPNLRKQRLKDLVLLMLHLTHCGEYAKETVVICNLKKSRPLNC